MSPTDAKRIDALTDEQKSRFGDWSAKWIEIGLRTGPADRPAFERHVVECYRSAGLEPPKRIVWTTSPLALAYAAPTAAFCIELRKRIMQNRDLAVVMKDPVDASVRESVRESVGESVDASVAVSVRESVDASVRVSVRESVRASVRASVRESVGESVDASVRESVDASVRESVRESVGESVRESVGDDLLTKSAFQVISRSYYNYIRGQFGVGYGWYSWYGSPSVVSFFSEVCGLDLGDEMNARAKAYAGTCESACWWWPHKDFVMVSERPMHIDRDDRGRLHSATRKVIAWPDGWGLYRIHGVEVPEDVVLHPEAITASRIREERNAEVRRVMLGIFGQSRYIQEIGAKLVHSDVFGDLYRVEMADDEALQMVKVRNSTPEPDGSIKDYWLRVSPDVRTAHGAVASTFRNPRTGERLTAREYQPTVET